MHSSHLPSGGKHSSHPHSLHLHSGGACPYSTAPAPKTNATATPRPAPRPIYVTIDGVPVEFDTPPRIMNDFVMVQIRPIVKRLGCNIEWDGGTNTSYITQPGVPLQKTAVKSSEIKVYVNNKRINFIGQNPVNYEGHILMPSRGVVEALGFSVEWDANTRTQAISTKKR